MKGAPLLSHEVTVPAFRTKLGNAAAKSILFLLADSSNTDGFSYPSIDTIADRTELSRRQVLRVLQIFREIGLVDHKKVSSGKYRDTFQINLDILGGDLRAPFEAAFLKAQSKPVSETPCLRDAKPVSETQKPVSETSPPDPLLGRTVIEPSINGNLFPGSSPSPEEIKAEKKNRDIALAALIRDDLFPYYCERAKRDPALYTLTPMRLQKGVSRLGECLRKTKGDLPAAQKMFWRAIEALTESEWHMGKNDQRTIYNDWIRQLTKSPEKFEEWLEKGMAA